MADPYLEIAETPRILLAQTADLTIFTVTGRCVIHSIVGVVTTGLGAGANNALLKIKSFHLEIRWIILPTTTTGKA